LRGVWAGIIESSNGKARVTPAPRRNVRLGMYFLVMNIGSALLYNSIISRPLARRAFLAIPGRFQLLLHLERLALDHAEHQSREAVFVLLRAVHDRAHQGHIVIFGSAAEAV